MIPARVKRTLHERELVVRGDHVLVACSGGPDSTVLLHVLHRVRRDMGITLCAASIDHGIRAESASEVEQVAELAASLGVPFRSSRITVPSEEPSLQARARTVRYEALHRLAESLRASKIAVGHTMDDQAETVLSRLLRGTGLSGLSGIAPRRPDGVIRPLIDCARDDVLRYAADHQLPFVDDPSNHQPGYERVRIRREVLPVLKREDARVVDHLCNLADEARELAALDADLPPPPAPVTRSLALSDTLGVPPPLRARWLRRWLEAETGATVGRTHLSAIDRLLTGHGEVLLRSGWAVRRDGERLFLEYRENRQTRSNR